MLAFHDADTDTDTDTDSPNTATILRPTRAISSRACVGRKIVAMFGESVSVPVSASWNVSYNERHSERAVGSCMSHPDDSGVVTGRIGEEKHEEKSEARRMDAMRRCWPAAAAAAAAARQ